MRPKNELINKLNSCYCELQDTNRELCINGHEFVNNEIREQCQNLVLTDEQLKELVKRFDIAIEKGLGKATNSSASVKCYCTFVQDLPNGKERGKFLALDLGGTNFRVLIIRLDDNHHFEMQSKIYAIPQNIMTGTGKQLFDHIAECLANFMSENDVFTERLPLGFTFSFPLEQVGLTKGILKTWTKGFSCSGVVNQDVVALLEEAIKRRGDIEIEVCGILNDTTGTLMSCCWKNPNCRVGVIVGTGCNACYTERVEKVQLYEGEKSKPLMIVNTEWGAMGDQNELDFIVTSYDKDVDSNSINPGKQLFEKMISGMYMGELVRLVIVKFTKEKILFEGKGSSKLNKRGNFLTKYVSDIESDKRGSHGKCRQVLNELGISHATDQDCINVRYICECISRRAAHLTSAGTACLVNRVGSSPVTIGVDGSVYRFHPHFHNLMYEKIGQLINPKIKFDLMLSEDGSGRGAALVAAVACRTRYGPDWINVSSNERLRKKKK